MAKIKTGWLKNREGDVFAPKTLSENVLTRNGITFEDEMAIKFNELSNKLDGGIADSLKNFSGEDSDEFYVIDAAGNIIFKVDKNGTTSVDFITPDGSLTDEINARATKDAELETNLANLDSKIKTLQEVTKNFEGGDADEFYIMDSKGNLIFKVDENGVTSIDFLTPDGSLSEKITGLQNELETDRINQANSITQLTSEINALNERTANIEGGEADEFYISDAQGNMAFKVDAEGASSMNFITPEGDLNAVLAKAIELSSLLTQEIQERQTADQIHSASISELEAGLLDEMNARMESDASISQNVTTLNNRATELDNKIDAETQAREDGDATLTSNVTEIYSQIKNISGGESDNFYIMDSQGNIIFKVDENGATSVNFNTLNGDLNAVIAESAETKTNLETEVAAREASDSTFATGISKLDTDLTNETKARTEAETAIKADISTLQTNASTLRSDLTDEIATRETSDSTFAADISEINTRTANLYGGVADEFYIMDSTGNIIFKVDENGTTSTNFNTLDGDLNATIADAAQLRADLETETAEREAADGSLTTDISELNTRLANETNARSESDEAINSKLTTLIADDADKSVRTIANEELAAQLIPEGAQESLDTLKEIADWIQSHPDDAAAMNSAIATKMDKENPTGTGSFSLNRKAGTTIGYHSVAIGYEVEASGTYSYASGSGAIASGESSHAEGYQTTASGIYSHSEGLFTQAVGNNAHAEGASAKATGGTSHAEGLGTNAIGAGSHAEGWHTIAEGQYQHVQGRYNIADSTSAHIVGNGTASSNTDIARSNAHTLDWNGNAWFAGDVYVGSTSGTNKDEGSLKLATENFVSGSYLPLSGGALDGDLTISGDLAVTGEISGEMVVGAVWNDYAEYRAVPNPVQPGRVIQEVGDDTLKLADGRLLPGCEIVTDTFGFAIGKTETSQTPVAVSGRVLAYPYEDKESYAPGDAVCSGPNGTVSKMTRDEIREFPERIVGTVSAIPTYETWGPHNIAVNGRIWIKIK